ncbi:hypothetical protein [Absidia glauca]|uniref:Uncharacterized protein n=1 Tax=Absidia glauca TaxID=4829 RepID=A0A168LNY1_ABSGL|nr:hypothetical protein [Absidia glauca]
MSLYLSSNKPRSLHRQPQPHSSHDSPIPPKLEKTLDKWLGRTNSSYGHSLLFGNNPATGFYLNLSDHSSQSSLDSSALNESQLTLSTSPPPLLMSSSCSSPAASTTLTSEQRPGSCCPCCQLPQCKAWKKTANTVQKLETETCLAAEIGQSLLQKNEDCRMESNQLKTKMKHYQDRIHELEASLGDCETLASHLHQEKEKWKRQCEKSEKNLNRSVKDLETAHVNCAVLAKELQQAKQKVEKLELFKSKSQQCYAHQDALRLKLEETKKELTLSKRSEATLTSENKRLDMANDMLSYFYKDLCNKHTMHQKTMSRHIPPSPSPLSIRSTPTPSTATVQRTSANEMALLIKNLQSENCDLKRDLDDTSARLDDARDETIALKEKYSAIMDTDKTTEPQSPQQTIQRSNFADRLVALTSQSASSNNNTHSPMPRASTSSPALHTPPAAEHHSPASISSDLLDQTRDIVRRLDSTDMRILNRRLQRTFDIKQLSQISNTVLENIMTDVDTMDARFFWLAPDESDDDDDNEPCADSMASLVHLIQDLLRHIVQSSMTINQLQVAYVEKVEEAEARVKLDFLKTQQKGVVDDPLSTACSSSSSMLTNGPHSPPTTTTTTTTTKRDDRPTHGSLRGIKSRTCQLRRQPSYSNDKNDSFWASVMMMGDWRMMTLKTSSSSLDREWLLWN